MKKTSAPLTVYVQVTQQGAWHADASSTRGTSCEAIAREQDVAVIQAVRRLAEAEGLTFGICLGCEGPLESELCRVAAVAHPACIEVEVEDEDEQGGGA